MKIHSAVFVYFLFLFSLSSTEINSISIGKVKSKQGVDLVPHEGCVELFSDCNFEGQSRIFCQNEPDFSKIEWNDIASSLKLGPNTQVFLYSDALYLGKVMNYIQDVSCFIQDDFNDIASSLQIEQYIRPTVNRDPLIIPAPVAVHEDEPVSYGCAELFTQCDYQGRKEVICSMQENFVNINFNDMVNSVRLGPDTEATLWSDIDFSGDALNISKNMKCLINQDFDNKASSIKIFMIAVDPVPEPAPSPIQPQILQKHCVELFSFCDYQGASKTLCHDDENFVQLGFNDETASILLGPDTKIILYEHINYEGRAIVVDSNQPCLATSTHPDLRFIDLKASSLRILDIKVCPEGK
jgi:hypothetical protein